MPNYRARARANPGIRRLRHKNKGRADQKVFLTKVDGTVNAGLGRVWVTTPAGVDVNGYTTNAETFKVFSGGRNFSTHDGSPIWIGWRHGALKVVDIDDVELVASGIEPKRLNTGQPENTYLRLKNALRFMARPMSDGTNNTTYVGVKGIVLQDAYGDLVHGSVNINSTKPNLATHIPAADMHNIAVIFFRPYTGTFHIYSSTAQSMSTALDLTDYQECIDQSYINEDIPGQGFKLANAQAYVDMTHLGEDLRNFLNVQSAVGFPTTVNRPHLIRSNRTVTTAPDVTIDSVLTVDGRLTVIGS